MGNDDIRIEVQCACGKNYKVSRQFSGRKVRCKSCGKEFLVPVVSEDSIPDGGLDHSGSAAKPENVSPAEIENDQKILDPWDSTEFDESLGDLSDPEGGVIADSPKPARKRKTKKKKVKVHKTTHHASTWSFTDWFSSLREITIFEIGLHVWLFGLFFLVVMVVIAIIVVPGFNPWPYYTIEEFERTIPGAILADSKENGLLVTIHNTSKGSIRCRVKTDVTRVALIGRSERINLKGKAQGGESIAVFDQWAEDGVAFKLVMSGKKDDNYCEINGEAFDMSIHILWKPGSGLKEVRYNGEDVPARWW